MARRHQSLIPLARDHHECLILARRLMHGSTAPDTQWPSEPSSQAMVLGDFFERHLRHHFAVEEEFVFPAAQHAGADAVALVSRLVSEHQRLAELVRTLLAATDVSVEDLAAFGALLNAHIRLEDRTLFPLMESRLPPAALLQLQREVESRYR